VEYQLGGATFHKRAIMVGAGGVFLESDDPIPLGSEVLLQFRPARHLPTIKTKAKACYQLTGRGFALEFTDILPRDRLSLLKFVLRKMGDRRKYPRAQLATQVQCNETLLLAFSRDVSVGGLFVETHEPMKEGTQLTVRFSLDDNGPAIVATGEVNFEVETLGMGIRFTNLSPEDRQRIETYVTRNTPLLETRERSRKAR
jgi:uncharacterized protein (TIGR02266 family)